MLQFKLVSLSSVTNGSSPISFANWISVSSAIFAIIVFVSVSALGQSADKIGSPKVVQPGAPGQATKTLPADTTAKLTPSSPKNAEFMQGMIMHHAQAVEMTDMIEARTSNKAIRLVGARISQSQSDEMAFMKRWLLARGESVEMAMPANTGSHAHGSHSADHSMLMPGMLSPKQIQALKNAEGAEFDRLFLAGMIQHHEGALVMVKDLFDTPGAGQDAELFNFASDVDSGQRAEIKTMQSLLDKIS
jgi:uncharacterized protein (DUF305 family)